MDTKNSKHKQPKAEEQKPMWQESCKEGGKPRCKKSSTNITKSSHAKLCVGKVLPECTESNRNIDKSIRVTPKAKEVKSVWPQLREKSGNPGCKESNIGIKNST